MFRGSLLLFLVCENLIKNKYSFLFKVYGL